MKVRRRLLNLATILSAGILALSLFAWPASYRQQFGVTYVAWPRTYHGANCVNGRLLAWTCEQNMAHRPQGLHGFNEVGASPIDWNFAGRPVWRVLGVIAESTDTAYGYRSRSLVVPFWMTALAASVLPLVWVRRMIRARRKAKEGHCRRCGYDLRETPKRCPECGTVASA